MTEIGRESPAPPRGDPGREPSEVPELCVLVPVCERPEALLDLYEEYRAVLDSIGRRYEFLFVVEPQARDIMEPFVRMSEQGEPVRVLEAGQDVGESMLLRAAAMLHSAPVMITIPPYPRIEPAFIVELLRRVDAGADMATASRNVSNNPWLNRLQRHMFNWLLRLGSGSHLQDVASGVRVFRRTVLEEIPLHGDFFRFVPVLAEREGFRVEEVSVPQDPRSSRPRLHSPGTYLRRVLDLLGLMFLVRFTRKPLRFFGLFGSIVSGVGGVILLVLFVQRLGGQSLADRPMLLLGVLLFVLGVQAIALGLLGEIVVHLDSANRPTYRLAGGRRPSSRDGGRP